MELCYLFPPTALTPPARGIIHASNIGLLLTIIGLLTAMLSVHRYLTAQRQIREQRYQASNGLILLFAAVVIVLGFLIVWYLIEGMQTR